MPIPKIPLDKTEQKHFSKLILIVFLICVASVCVSITKMITYEKVDAIITDNHVTSSVRGGNIQNAVVSYVYNNQQYSAEIKFSSKKHLNIGQTLEVYCNPENPDTVTTISKIFTIPMILIIIDVILFVVFRFWSEKV